MLLARDKSQLLIVDVQEKLIEAISGKDRVIDRCIRLVRAARTLDVPITVSEQYPQGLCNPPATRSAMRWPMPRWSPTRWSSPASGTSSCASACAASPPGGPQVVVAGIEAHVCVLQTAIDLEAQDFEAFVVADATGSRAKDSRKLALARLAKAGADVVEQRDGAVRVA